MLEKPRSYQCDGTEGAMHMRQSFVLNYTQSYFFILDDLFQPTIV